MPAYIVGIVDELLDPEAMGHYIEQIDPLIAEHGGRYVFVSDKVQVDRRGPAAGDARRRRVRRHGSAPGLLGVPGARPTSKPCGSAAPAAASSLSMRRRWLGMRDADPSRVSLVPWSTG